MSQNVDTASLSARRCLLPDSLSSANAETTSCPETVCVLVSGRRTRCQYKLLPEGGGGACSIFTDQQVSLI